MKDSFYQHHFPGTHKTVFIGLGRRTHALAHIDTLADTNFNIHSTVADDDRSMSQRSYGSLSLKE